MKRSTNILLASLATLLAHVPSINSRTIDLFDWTGVTPTGAFNVDSPYAWELSQLYTTGQVTLTGVPEPGAVAFLGFGILCGLLNQRGPLSRSLYACR